MKTSPQARFQLAILAGHPDALEGLGDIPSIEWLVCKQTGDDQFDFYQGDAIVSSINLESPRFDLPNLLGIIVVGSADAFEAIKDRWHTRLPAVGLAFVRIPKCENYAILSAAIACLTHDLELHRGHSGRAALELATYRREFERLQHSFSRLEEYVGRQFFPRATEIFEYPPDQGAAWENSRPRQAQGEAATTSHSLIQPLPVNSSGVSSVAINISAKPEGEAGPLGIKLKAIETGHIYGTWSLEADQTPDGWVELALNHAIDEPALSLVIVVEWPPETAGWALALGPPHPYKEFCARTEMGDPLAAPLSLRVFRSLPGVRVPATTTAIRPLDAPNALAQLIPDEAYGKIAQILPAEAGGEAGLVSFDPEIGCITVHPHPAGLTVARITVAVPPNVWGLSAQIHLAHERASDTQFAMMVCTPREETRELARLSQLNAPTPNFSGWKNLRPMERKSIAAPIPASPEERLSIYLVTRQAPDASPDFAWARFNRLEFNLLPNSLVGERQASVVSPDVLADVPAPAVVGPTRKTKAATLGMESNAKSR